ncbi:MAG TPA: hypothetical protein VHM70_25800 [Polyangiaceae bacterium]|jgi:hypothetical protein|nr:hypothetical protein [Polyangiaceae bacterium]
MKRKEMLLALAAVMLPWRSARAEVTKRLPVRAAEPSTPAPVPTVESLQEQVTSLLARVQALETAQASQVGFTRKGNDLVLEPSQGNVIVRTHQGGSVELTADNSMKIKTGAAFQLESSSTLQIKSSGDMVIKGAKVDIN